MRCKYCKEYVYFFDWILNLGKCNLCVYRFARIKLFEKESKRLFQIEKDKRSKGALQCSENQQ